VGREEMPGPGQEFRFLVVMFLFIQYIRHGR
jgi:hypothetical protein